MTDGTDVKLFEEYEKLKNTPIYTQEWADKEYCFKLALKKADAILNMVNEIDIAVGKVIFPNFQG